MKILLYSDNHWASSTSVLRGHGTRYSIKLENQIDSINWVNQIASEFKCDRIICLGDFFDKPVLAAEELTALKEIDVTNHEFIVGNHEIERGDLVYSSAHVFSGASILYNKITIFTINNTQFLILPYMTDDNRPSIESIVRDNNLNKERLIILSHNDVRDLQYGYYKSTIGISQEDILNNCKLFINGHIHNGGTFNNKIVNIGSLTGINFGNNGDTWKTGVIILDTETLDFKRVENPHAIKFYKQELLNIEDIQNYVNSRADGRSIISIKVPSTLVEQSRAILDKVRDKFIYSRLQINYVINKEIVQESVEKEMSNSTHFDKFKKFVSSKYGDGSINLTLMLEELSLIGGV